MGRYGSRSWLGGCEERNDGDDVGDGGDSEFEEEQIVEG